MRSSRVSDAKEKIAEARAAVYGDIAWSRGLLKKLEGLRLVSGFDSSKMVSAIYRPFIVQNLYYDREFFVEMPGTWNRVFCPGLTRNLLICCSGVGAKEFSCLAVDRISCLDCLEKSQYFPRWLPKENSASQEVLDFGYENDDRESGISEDALPHFQKAYLGHTITEDDLFYYIYGILNSEDYRTRYANNLMKELPRIPRVATYEQFRAFADAGRKLADLHVNYERVAPYAGVKLVKKEGSADYRVTQMKWGKIPGKKGNAAKDKSRLVYNDWLTIENIPLEAQEYVVNKKSALDWVVENACVSTDAKSGIVNDFNDYAAEIGNPRYPLELVLKVITVSLETVKIVKGLPALEIHPLDA